MRASDHIRVDTPQGVTASRRSSAYTNDARAGIIASIYMAIEALSAKEQEIVLQCMRATAAHIDNWEMCTRLGLEAEDLQRIIARWPNLDDRDEGGLDFLAINNCMNEVCHGFAIEPVEWSNWFVVSMSDIQSTYRKWIALKGTVGGIR